MTPQGRPKEFDLQEALERALMTFWDNGFAATGIADLTKAMGIGRQSLYDTFGDKRGLYKMALTAYCDQQHQEVAGILAGQGTPGERISAFLTAWSEMFEENKGCMIANTIGEFSSRGDEEILDLMKHSHLRFEQLIEAAFQAAIDSKEIPQHLDAKDLTKAIMATNHGISVGAPLTNAADAARAATRTFKALLGL